ncbi:MotA/TolQ/ExbB proton channel family protein [Tundrisphaera sp. TA3]|uniref:MotA/TolQ/ExbB proton channel family protein n=1 Tax=Tundrisphaera sp. TA3 TaxID=3435775 RepID=UPI003EBD75D6
MLRRCLGTLGLSLALALVLTSGASLAQDPAIPSPVTTPVDVSQETIAPAARAAGTKPAATGVGRQSILTLFKSANPMLLLLGLCSIVTVGYTLERLVALRRGRVIPKDFVHRFTERLSGGKLDRDRAAELCRSNESAVARVFGHVVRYWGQPAATIRQAVDHDAAREVADLKRNIRVLNGTATLAPLLGLLGTVIGMIQSFDAIGGRAGGAKGELLAQGISLALISTAVGLGIAVVSVAVYYFLLNRVDVLVRELDDHARSAIDLVCAEALRPAMDRRIDHARSESRLH